MYKFTMDFDYGNGLGGAKRNIAQLINAFGIPNTIIEIGVFEGGTTFWMNDELCRSNPDLTIYAIDPHVGSNDISKDFTMVSDNFNHNMQVCPDNKIKHIKLPSEDGLIYLRNIGAKAELIYIDGDHRAGPVMSDLVLAWKLLRKGGVILCDDTTVWKYDDGSNTFPAQMSPRMAVEFFIQCHWHELQLISLDNPIQTAFMKTV